MNLNQNTANLMSNNDKRKLLSDFGNTIDINNRFDKNAARVAEIISGKTPTNNRDSKNLITGFLKDIDVDALMAVFVLAGTIITSTVKFYRNMRKLNEDTPIEKFEAIDEINLDSDKIAALFESEDFQNLDIGMQQSIESEINDSNIKKVLDDSKYQFEFESGHFMEAINSNKITSLSFSLAHHKETTNNISEFIESVRLFLSSANVELTDTDIRRLTIHYNKY